MKKYKKTTILIITTILSACSSNIKIDDFNYDYKNESVYGDELSLIIDDYIKNNQELKIQKESIKQTYINEKIGKTTLFPKLNASYNAGVSKDGKNKNNSSSFSLSSNYDLDIWGNIYNAVNVLEITKKIAEENYKEYLNSGILNIKQKYNTIIEINKKIPLYKELINKNNEKLNILNKQINYGNIDFIDIENQKNIINKYQKELINIINEKKIIQEEIRLLTGNNYDINSGDFIIGKEKNDKNLLERPDIKSALLAIEQQNYSLSIAIKNKYPQLSISTNITNSNINYNINNWIISLFGNIVMPIIDYDEYKLKEMIEESKLNQSIYNFSYLLMQYKYEYESILNEINVINNTKELNENENSLLAKKGLILSNKIKYSSEYLINNIDNKTNQLINKIELIDIEKNLNNKELELNYKMNNN